MREYRLDRARGTRPLKVTIEARGSGRSTPHGVVNDSGRDRYSIAFFYSPNIAARIECLPTCTGADHPARYEPAVYGDLVKAFYSANYFHQKDHVRAA